jgi:DNA mismatch repair protein MutL
MLHIRHAHQRVRFETIQKSFHEEAPTSQRLLLPLPLEFEPLAAEALQRQLKQLNSYGFDIQEFGRNFYRIEAVPTWLNSHHAEDFIRDLIDAVRQRDMSRKPTEILTGIMAQLATKNSYQANDPINAEQVEALLRDLLRCDNPHTAPNGKPTLSEISWSDWRRRLGDD